MIRPENNQALLEVVDEFQGVSYDTAGAETQVGIVRDINLSQLHLTASTGFFIPDEFMEAYEIWHKRLIGQTVRYQSYADADSKKFEHEGKQYVLVPWYRIIASEWESPELIQSNKKGED